MEEIEKTSKGMLVKRISALTVAILIISSFSNLTSSEAQENTEIVQKEITSVAVLEDLTTTNITNLDEVKVTKEIAELAEEIELNEGLLSDDFDFEEAAVNLPSIQEMTNEEKEVFNQIVDEQVNLMGLESKQDKKVVGDLLTNFFDEESETYNDFEALLEETEKVEEVLVTTKTEDIGNTTFIKEEYTVSNVLEILSVQEASAISLKGKVRVTNRVAGAAFNVVLGLVVGGGLGAITAYIKQKGKNAASQMFGRTLKTKLTQWGAPKLAIAVTGVTLYAVAYLDPGNAIAKRLDKLDKKPNNGYVDMY